MKSHVKIVLLVMLTAGFSSCEQFKKNLDVEFESTLSGDLNIEVQESAMKSANNYPFESSLTLDPLSDEELAKYQEKIVEIRIDDIIGTIDDVSGEDVVFLSGTVFSIANSSDSVSWTLSNDWPILQDMEVILEDDDTGVIYDGVSNILSTLEEFTVRIVGTCSQTTVFVTLRIDIETSVTANPL